MVMTEHALLHNLMAPAMGVQPMAYQWLCLDIETANARPEDAENFIINCYRPEAFGSWKNETIGQRIKDAHAAKASLLSCMDESPIICVSLRSDYETRVLHCMAQQDPTNVEGALVEGFSEPKAMLRALRTLLDGYTTPETVLVGHNISHFDLPKLRHQMVKQSVRMPGALRDPNQPVFDTMVQYFRRFSLKGEKLMLPLKTLCSEFGIETHKDTVDGSMIPKLFEQGEFDTIIKYAILDVIAESELYLRMTGASANLS